MNIDVDVAWVGLLVASLTAVLTYRQVHSIQERTAKAETGLEQLRATNAAQAAERDARRDYEYEARKRLYAECEPLLFRLGELTNDTLSRVERLAESAREGYLHPYFDGWLVEQGYFMKSTAYRIIAPLVYVRLLQRTLTTVDLTVDSDLRGQYRLARVLYRSITDDFKLAEQAPALQYDPNHPDAGDSDRSDEAVYRRQGLYSGVRDAAVEALTVRDEGSPPRCMDFGEFDFALTEVGQVSGAFEPVFRLLRSFHPADHPVLWRILIAQAVICTAIRQSQDAKMAAETSEVTPSSALDLQLDKQLFDWRGETRSASDEEVLEIPFRAARSYLEHRLSH